MELRGFFILEVLTDVGFSGGHVFCSKGRTFLHIGLFACNLEMVG